jgi:C-terminal processing protease CtpA/Prc
VLLVDRGCASACEMTVALARQIPGVIVAGERTRGSMAAGEIALFRLPRSGVLVTLGTRAFRDPLGGFAETRGFVPDVLLAGADAAARAEALARGGLPPATPHGEHDPGGGSRVETPERTWVSSWR